MTTTEDKLLPAVYELLQQVSWPPTPQNPKGPRVLFGAYRAVANVELVAVTGLTNSTIEPNREESIEFTINTLVNVAGLDEVKTWERRAEVTTALIEALQVSQTPPNLIRDTGVISWRISARETSVEPATDAIPGSTGWVGHSELTITARARPCA